MITTKAALAATATLVALAFACSTLERWLASRRAHQLDWTVSLAMFTVASGALWWGVSAGWDEGSWRVFFLFGAVLNVVWLALGNVELLRGPAGAPLLRRSVAVVSGFAAGVVVTAPLRAPLPSDELPRGRDVFGVLPRVLAAVGSGVGALVVIGCTVWSATRVWRGRSRPGGALPGLARPGRLVVGNLLLALGTLILGASGTLAGRLGEDEAFALTLAVGVCVLFAGFLVAGTAGRTAPT